MPERRQLKDGELPDLPQRPAGFEPDVLASGDPLVARLVWQLMNENPELRRQVSGVSTGPTSGTLLRLRDSKIPQEMLDQTNLMGLTDTERGEVYINPEGNDRSMNKPPVDANFFDNPQILSTLIHEFAHAQGKDEVDARLEQLKEPSEHYQNHMGRAMRPTRRKSPK